MIFLSIALSIVFFAFTINQEIKAGPGGNDSQMLTPCKQAFEGKCLHGKELFIEFGDIMGPEDLEPWCLENQSGCSVYECATRLGVISGFLPASSTGNPCFAEGYK
jgi:hypothetical protein